MNIRLGLVDMQKLISTKTNNNKRHWNDKNILEESSSKPEGPNLLRIIQSVDLISLYIIEAESIHFTISSNGNLFATAYNLSLEKQNDKKMKLKYIY